MSTLPQLSPTMPQTLPFVATMPEFCLNYASTMFWYVAELPNILYTIAFKKAYNLNMTAIILNLCHVHILKVTVANKITYTQLAPRK